MPNKEYSLLSFYCDPTTSIYSLLFNTAINNEASTMLGPHLQIETKHSPHVSSTLQFRVGERGLVAVAEVPPRVMGDSGVESA